MRNRTTYNEFYKGFPINTDEDLGQGCYEEILDNSISQLHAMLERYSRIYIIRFDLHLPEQVHHKRGNGFVSLFFKTLGIRLAAAKAGGHKYMAYQWVREVEKSKKAHYHCWIGLSGHKTYKTGSLGIDGSAGSGVLGMIQELWTMISGGSIGISIEPYYNLGKQERAVGRMVHRGDSAEIERCIYHLSYLAKVRGKQYGTGVTYARHGSSRLKLLGPIGEEGKVA